MKKAFTLIELVAVIVILGIVSLIVAPLVLNTIRKAKISAYKRSIDGYGRAAEYAISNYEVKNMPYPGDFSELEIEYSGNKVECEISRINPDHTIYLSECKVNGKSVKDDSSSDGYYHYGKLKLTNIEYVDTYGKYLEDALKEYYEEYNEYPSDYTELTVKELDKSVNCDVSINHGGKVYLTNCKVNNETVLDNENNTYEYGKYVPSYVMGDLIQFAGSKWYVIEDSSTMKDYVVILKETVLTNEELGEYAINDTYDTMGYYWSDTCHWENLYGYSDRDNTDCNNIDYSNSKIREMLETRYMPTLDESNLKEIDGYKIRIVSQSELRNNLGYGENNNKNDNVPSWIYSHFGENQNNVSAYWTMSNRMGPFVTANGNLFNSSSDWRYGQRFGVRPVINLYKDSIGRL